MAISLLIMLRSTRNWIISFPRKTCYTNLHYVDRLHTSIKAMKALIQTECFNKNFAYDFDSLVLPIMEHAHCQSKRCKASTQTLNPSNAESTFVQSTRM